MVGSNINLTHLLKQLEANMRVANIQMDMLVRSVDNLKGSWLAINETHKNFQREMKEEY